MNSLRSVRPALLIAGFSCVLALAFAFDITPWLRGGYGWRWEYAPAPLGRALPLGIALVIYLAGAWWLVRTRYIVSLRLIWAFFGTVALAVAVMYLRDGDALYTVFARTASLLGTGPHYAAAHLDWQSGEWQQWTAVMGRFGGHMSNVPPGSLMWYGLLNDVLTRFPAVSERLGRALLAYQCQNPDLLTYSPAQWASAWFGALMPVWSALAVFPLYGVARKVLSADVDNAAASSVVLWWPLVPGIAAFAGSWNTFYPVLSLIAFWWLMLGLEKQAKQTKQAKAAAHEKRARWPLWILASGLLSGIALFINFAFIPMPLLFGLYTLGYCIWTSPLVSLSMNTEGEQLAGQTEAINRASARYGSAFGRAVMVGLCYCLGFILPWAVFWLATRETFFDLLFTSMSFHLDLDRPYWFWVGMHLWDWIVWTGAGLALLTIFGLWRGIRNKDNAPPLLSAVLSLTMLILILSGTARGETGRVWLWFSPFLLITAYDGLRRMSVNAASADQSAGGYTTPPLQSALAWLAITVGQAALFAVLTVCISLMATGFTYPPALPAQDTANLQMPLNAQFNDMQGGAFRLIGWEAESRPDTITLRLHWQGDTPPFAAYWFGGVLVAPDGQTSPVDPWQPNALPGEAASFPTACWQHGVTVGDEVTFALPENAASGDWWFSLAAYDRDGAPLKVVKDEVEDIQVGLGPVRVGQ